MFVYENRVVTTGQATLHSMAYHYRVRIGIITIGFLAPSVFRARYVERCAPLGVASQLPVCRFPNQRPSSSEYSRLTYGRLPCQYTARTHEHKMSNQAYSQSEDPKSLISRLKPSSEVNSCWHSLSFQNLHMLILSHVSYFQAFVVIHYSASKAVLKAI